MRTLVIKGELARVKEKLRESRLGEFLWRALILLLYKGVLCAMLKL